MSTSIFCPHCQRYTALSIAPVEYTGDYGSKYKIAASWDTGRGDKWWIGICNNCSNPVLVLNDGQEIYPKPFPSPTDTRIPDPMRQDILEAKLCYSIDAFRGCAVMARRAMQNACIEKGATKKDLVNQIDELLTNGIITKDLKEWATVVRWVGNDAAHPNKGNVEKEDAEDLLNLAEQFLQVLYVAPAIAKARKSIRRK